MNSKIVNLLMLKDLITNIEFDDYSNDIEVNNCQMLMYLMLIDSNEKIEKRFIEAYDKLDKDKQEYIKNDFRMICEDQDEIKQKER